MQGTVSMTLWTSSTRYWLLCFLFSYWCRRRSVECNADSMLAFSSVLGRAGPIGKLVAAPPIILSLVRHPSTRSAVSLPSPIPRDVFPSIDFSPRLNPTSRVSQLVTQWFTVIHSASEKEDLEENIRSPISIAFVQVLPGKSRILRNQLTAKRK